MLIKILALITNSFLSFLIGEMLFSLIFTIKNGKIKYTLDFGLSKYRKTSVFILVFSTLIVLSFLVGNWTSGFVTNLLMKLNYSILFLMFVIIPFSIFWMSKIILNRKWKFKWTWIPFSISIVSTLSWILSIILRSRF